MQCYERQTPGGPHLTLFSPSFSSPWAQTLGLVSNIQAFPNLILSWSREVQEEVSRSLREHGDQESSEGPWHPLASVERENLLKLLSSFRV